MSIYQLSLQISDQHSLCAAECRKKWQAFRRSVSQVARFQCSDYFPFFFFTNIWYVWFHIIIFIMLLSSLILQFFFFLFFLVFFSCSSFIITYYSYSYSYYRIIPRFSFPFFHSLPFSNFLLLPSLTEHSKASVTSGGARHYCPASKQQCRGRKAKQTPYIIPLLKSTHRTKGLIIEPYYAALSAFM